MSSIVSFQGTPWSSHYAATKAYVQVLAEGLNRELKSVNVDVLAVATGQVPNGTHLWSVQCEPTSLSTGQEQRCA